MLTLGIDCATWTASVGVSRDGEIAADLSQRVSSHASHLLGLIDQALGAADNRLDEIDLISVSQGPGSFTGLRIALSTAMGIALATGARVVGVSTLEALALAAGRRAGLICPVLDARKGEVYTAAFRAAAPGVVRVSADSAISPRRLAAALDSPCTLVGDGVDAYRGLWEEVLPNAELVPFDCVFPSGAIVARLGAERLASDGTCDLVHLEPLYCRQAEAEMKRPR